MEGAEEKPADRSEAIQRTVTNEGPLSSSSSSSSATCCTQPQNVANAEKHTTFCSERQSWSSVADSSGASSLSVAGGLGAEDETGDEDIRGTCKLWRRGIESLREQQGRRGTWPLLRARCTASIYTCRQPEPSRAQDLILMLPLTLQFFRPVPSSMPGADAETSNPGPPAAE